MRTDVPVCETVRVFLRMPAGVKRRPCETRTADLGLFVLQMKLNDDGMCSFDDFEKFMEYEPLKDLGTDKSYRELCAHELV